MIKAKTPKNQSAVNKAVKALLKYNELNDQRDKLEKESPAINRKCENAFDKYLELAGELTKADRAAIEKKYY